MKLCKNCKYYDFKRDVIHERDRIGNTIAKPIELHMCVHPDFANPVDGSAIPAIHSRQDLRLCTLEGKGFVALPTKKNEKNNKDDSKPIIELV